MQVRGTTANNSPTRLLVFVLGTVASFLGLCWLTKYRHAIPTAPRTFGAMQGSQAHVNGKVQVVYFTNWSIYGRKYFPWDLPFAQITHILYSFANVRPDSGEVYLSDAWSDEQIRWTDRGDSWNEPPGANNLYGCLNQLRQAKLRHRHVKILLSIGGWTWSSNLATAFSHEHGRQMFADSCVKLVEDYGFDGIDVDFEFPKDSTQARNWSDALRRTREALDHLAASKGEPHPYLLTVAAPCGTTNYQRLDVHGMDRHLSFWNLMAYDFAGTWSSLAGHHANLFPSRHGFTNEDKQSVSAAVDFYTSTGVHPSRLVIGVPLYGRSFANTNGLGKPFSGPGEGSWDPGSLDYKALPRPGAVSQGFPDVVGTIDYDPQKRELVSYDSPNDATAKADWIVNRGLGGAMFWEASGDKPVESGQSLMATLAYRLGALDSTPNHLFFPGSRFDNLKSQAQGPERGSAGPGLQQAPPPVPMSTRPGGPGLVQKVKGAFH